MTTWYSLDIGNDNAAKSTLQRVMDSFMPKYIGAGRPLGMAVFSGKNPETDQMTLYFAPKAVSLAIQFSASPHDGKFVDTELTLLVGDEKSIDHLFPMKS